MVDGAPEHEGINFGATFKELEIVAYIDDLRIVGFAHFGVTTRASSRRSSDYLRAFEDSRLTLSRVRIYDKNSGELHETAPFVLLNLDRVDFLYAREEGEGAPSG